jgi:hypothetical protein
MHAETNFLAPFERGISACLLSSQRMDEAPRPLGAQQALGLELFRNVGVEPTERKLLVVTSTNHFHAELGPVAKKVLYVDSDGPLPRDYTRIPY